MNAIVIDPTLWTDVGAVTDIPLRGARRVPTPVGVVAIFRTGDGALYALKDACPLHNWSIDLATGEPLGADRGKGCTPVVPLKVRDGRLLIGRV